MSQQLILGNKHQPLPQTDQVTLLLPFATLTVPLPINMIVATGQLLSTLPATTDRSFHVIVFHRLSHCCLLDH